MAPQVSVLTPTYNRRQFLPGLLACYKGQEFPLEKMEWIILDDGEDSVEDFFTTVAKTVPNVRYIRHPTKLLIGAKRNILNREARGQILIAMDDDDYYSPERVKHVVVSFARNPTVELAGCSELYMYYTDIRKIYKLGPYHPNHATNGTMAWRRSFALSHTYDETVTHAEERSFLDNYTHPMIQLDPFKTMLVISHTSNTFDKKELRDKPNPMMKLTAFTMRRFIKESELRTFYSNV
jgi:glycosyltransferase involved in cell wall biosynthesis